jgi:hypothetical protein
MPIAFDILDETTSGECRDAGTFTSESSATTLREMIRLRVRQEVDRFNHSESPVFQGFIQPEETERILNGARPTHRPLDWEKQYASAIGAFQGNGFLVLVDDRQIMGLDETIHLEPQTRITFLKLVPLIGG